MLNILDCTTCQARCVYTYIHYLSTISLIAHNNKQEEITYEAVHNNNYLDMVVQESLRRYPPVVTNRECTKTTVVGGITIPKGVIVRFPTFYIHHSPQYWDDPMVFDPERFVS